MASHLPRADSGILLAHFYLGHSHHIAPGATGVPALQVAPLLRRLNLSPQGFA